MPNWCANNLKILGHADSIAEIKKLMLGEITPFYRKAIDASIKFFVAGMASIAKPIPNQLRIPDQELEVISLPGHFLVPGQPVEATPLNMAFTQWLNLLRTNPDLSAENSKQILQWYEQSGLAHLELSTLSQEQKALIHNLFKTQPYDWFGSHGYSEDKLEYFWQSLDSKEYSGMELDMRLIIPPQLIPELVGFNGHLLGKMFNSPLSAYSSYCDTYGVKWPCGYELHLEAFESLSLPDTAVDSPNQLMVQDAKFQALSVDFDTPWSPPNQNVISALSRIYQCQVSHYYCEQGCDYCGYQQFIAGELVDQYEARLQWSEVDENDEDAYVDIIGPDFVLEHLSHYGG